MSESNRPIGDLMSTTLQKIKEMIDVDTVVGKPIETPDGVVLIPLSQVSLAFASGGSSFGKNPQPSANNFGGGGAAGVKIDPVAFLIVRGDSVRLLPVSSSGTTVDRVIDMVPEVVDKISGYVEKFRADKNED